MKSIYRATRGDKRNLLRDIKPGMSLFVINEHAGNWGPGKTYSEWIVTTKKAPITGNPLAQSPAHGGYESVPSLLAKEREIHTQRPNLPNRGAPERHDAYTEEAQRAAKHVADLHSMQVSGEMANRWATAGRR